MPRLHDSATRSAIKSRLQTLKPDARGRWGKMTVDQMMWHVNTGLEIALGRVKAAPAKAPLPRPILRFAVLNLPWPKGRAQTFPEMVATGTYDFEAERKRCARLLDEFAAKELAGPWPDSPFLGPMSGGDHTRLQAKHVDHHLRQFGV